MRWVVGVVLMLVSSARAYGDDYTIVPPAGWVPNEASAASSREGLARTPGVSGIDAKAWTPADSSPGHLYLTSFVIALASLPELEDFDRYVAGTFTTKFTVVSDQPLRSWAWGDGYLGDLTVVAAGHQIHVVRRYFGARDGVHGLLTMCEQVVGQSSCEGAMDSVQFPVKDAVPLRTRGYREPRAGNISDVVNTLLIVGAFTWLVRRRWARATAATDLRRSAHATPDAIGSGHDPVDPSRVESPDIGGPGPAEATSAQAGTPES